MNTQAALQMDPYAGSVTFNEPGELYFKREIDVANNSGLKVIGQKSGAHYLHYTMHPEDDDESEDKDFGNVLHTLALEPDRFHLRYAVLPENAPSRPTIRQIQAKHPSAETIKQIDWWQRWRDDHPGADDITTKQLHQAQLMSTSLRNHVLEIPDHTGQVIEVTCGELFEECAKEVTMRWRNPRTGIKCKARADLSSRVFRLGGDIKTTLDASEEGFARTVPRFFYHQQDVHYSEGAEQCDLGWDDFLFFCIEKKAPYVPAVYRVPPIGRERGDEIRNRALDRLAACLKANRWPPYHNKITDLVLPAYAFYD